MKWRQKQNEQIKTMNNEGETTKEFPLLNGQQHVSWGLKRGLRIKDEV